MERDRALFERGDCPDEGFNRRVGDFGDFATEAVVHGPGVRDCGLAVVALG